MASTGSGLCCLLRRCAVFSGLGSHMRLLLGLHLHTLWLFLWEGGAVVKRLNSQRNTTGVCRMTPRSQWAHSCQQPSAGHRAPHLHRHAVPTRAHRPLPCPRPPRLAGRVGSRDEEVRHPGLLPDSRENHRLVPVRRVLTAGRWAAWARKAPACPQLAERLSREQLSNPVQSLVCS